jgi:hypothetical protein
MDDAMRLESLVRNRTKELLAFLVEQFGFRCGLASPLTLQVVLTVIRQSDIQHLQQIHSRNGNQEVASRKIDQSFDMSLLVRSPHKTETIYEKVVALQPLKLARDFSFA